MQHWDRPVAAFLRPAAIAGLPVGLFEISMNPEKENFEPLCRLLKLKRHEQPPPRYFNDFSSQVVARIRAGEAGHRETVLDNGSWLMKLWSLIEAKPMLPGAVGVAFCALLVFGAIYTETSTSAPGPDI